jgi:hypothetical protein
MSEQSPRPNPRLVDFEVKRAAAEHAARERDREKFEKDIYGDAGQGDDPANYTEESRKRIEEADEYERHMEKMAKRPSYAPGSADEIRARVQDMHDLDGAPSRGYDLEWDNAIAENEAFDDRIKAADEALERTLSSDPALRFMDNLSREIATLREKAVNAYTIDADEARLHHLEDVLSERLERYATSETFDSTIADYLMDRADKATLVAARASALDAAEARSRADVVDATPSPINHPAVVRGPVSVVIDNRDIDLPLDDPAADTNVRPVQSPQPGLTLDDPNHPDYDWFFDARSADSPAVADAPSVARPGSVTGTPWLDLGINQQRHSTLDTPSPDVPAVEPPEVEKERGVRLHFFRGLLGAVLKAGVDDFHDGLESPKAKKEPKPVATGSLHADTDVLPAIDDRTKAEKPKTNFGDLMRRLSKLFERSMEPFGTTDAPKKRRLGHAAFVSGTLVPPATDPNSIVSTRPPLS